MSDCLVSLYSYSRQNIMYAAGNYAGVLHVGCGRDPVPAISHMVCLCDVKTMEKYIPLQKYGDADLLTRGIFCKDCKELFTNFYRILRYPVPASRLTKACSRKGNRSNNLNNKTLGVLNRGILFLLLMFSHLKLWIATATHNFKWLKNI